jgi:nucleoside-diphosphate-sugar epimerase
MLMRVFITGGTGFIGSALIEDLVANGHEAIGMSRSEKFEQEFTALGANVLERALENADNLKHVAEVADAAVHLAFVHNFADFATAWQIDK